MALLTDWLALVQAAHSGNSMPYSQLLLVEHDLTCLGTLAALTQLDRPPITTHIYLYAGPIGPQTERVWKKLLVRLQKQIPTPRPKPDNAYCASSHFRVNGPANVYAKNVSPHLPGVQAEWISRVSMDHGT